MSEDTSEETSVPGFDMESLNDVLDGELRVMLDFGMLKGIQLVQYALVGAFDRGAVPEKDHHGYKAALVAIDAVLSNIRNSVSGKARELDTKIATFPAKS